MIVRSIIFFGIVCIGSGLWCCLQAIDPFLLEGQVMKYRIPSRLLLFTGAMLLTIGLLSIAVCGRMVRVVLITISQVIGLAVLLEAIAGASAFAFDTTLTRGHLEQVFLKELEVEYSQEPRVTFAWDKLQNDFDCCGVFGPRDWNNSYWMKKRQFFNVTNLLPLSCCKVDTRICSTMNNLYRDQGCGTRAAEALRNHLRRSCLCALVCVFLHFTLYLATKYLHGRV